MLSNPGSDGASLNRQVVTSSGPDRRRCNLGRGRILEVHTVIGRHKHAGIVGADMVGFGRCPGGRHTKRRQCRLEGLIPLHWPQGGYGGNSSREGDPVY